jgi:hypothetical protein
MYTGNIINVGRRWSFKRENKPEVEDQAGRDQQHPKKTNYNRPIQTTESYMAPVDDISCLDFMTAAKG